MPPTVSNLPNPPLELRWHGRRIAVVHDPLEFTGFLSAEHELALHGHTHLYRLERERGLTIFNPGECAGHLAGHNAVGIVNLTDLSAEVMRF